MKNKKKSGLKFLIVNGHWNNRGDEAAIRALIDAIKNKYNNAEIVVQLYAGNIEQFPDINGVHAVTTNFPRTRNKIEFPLYLLTRGRVAIFKELKEFSKLLTDVDYVIHAPGGPSIGDIYAHDEDRYIYKLLAAYAKKIPYCFYTPSMGPFQNKERNIMRRFIYNHADFICCREEISKQYINQLELKNQVHVTLDSAFQNEIDVENNEQVLACYNELDEYLKSYSKVIGITVTDLKWHPVFKSKPDIWDKINDSFSELIKYLTENNYGVVFIPQLFGECNDSALMNTFNNGKCFVVSDLYDAYFQQFLIGKLFAVVGMRYHSNIFSAKMGTPFVSISYEQKMRGFMEKAGLSDYCIDINELDVFKLRDSFQRLLFNYEPVKMKLQMMHTNWRNESQKTTEMLFAALEKASHD